jgi:hypothetical protein
MLPALYASPDFHPISAIIFALNGKLMLPIVAML